MTLTDEVGRQQKVYSDVLGRAWKSEVLNWNGTVYSATTNTFNARDQITLARQWSGAENGGGAYQDTTMSYDGYGRLQTKHVPEQNAGTATVYAYNPDNTIQSVTDARGARASYIYNNGRHLVNEIHYSAPSGITPTSNVTFTYDAAGNRTSMTDGLGSQSYSYNQLSQMTSESRYFSALGQSYALSYDYNLAGQLKRITDSTNMTINYGFDSSGRLSNVTGSDNLFAGVSNYASNFQYRAFGGLKAMTDGTNHVTSAAYNSRMQPTQFDISGNAVHQNYDYSNDGRLSFVHNTTDIAFDRAYAYDHAGRLTSATSGGAARNDYGDRPYVETFGYDAFSNLTNRSSESWNGQTYDADGATYTNNRRTGWGYDADGRNTAIGTRTYTRDAVGRMNSMTAQQVLWNGNQVTVTQNFDYDGIGNKLRETTSGNTTYYLRSSVLSGAVIEELNSNGQKVVGHVYRPNGAQLARQSFDAVTWKQHTPAATGRYETYSNNSSVGRIELDPLGADISLTAPPEPPPSLGEGDVSAGHIGGIMDARWSDFFNLSSGCSAAGVAASCSGHMAGANMDAEMRAAFGYRWYDLPGNNDEMARGEERYLGILNGETPWGGLDPEFGWFWGTFTLSNGKTLKNPTLDQLAWETGYMPDSASSDQDEHDVSAPYHITIVAGASYFVSPQKKEEPMGGKTTGSALKKDPCAGIKILDYDKVRDYGSGANKVTESGRDHILRNHIDGRPGKSRYETDPPQDRNAMFLQVLFYNAVTFGLGTRKDTFNKKGQLDSITFTYQLPPDFPHHYYGPPITGMWIGRDQNGNPTLFNTLHLDPDCETVRTSYPGRPR